MRVYFFALICVGVVLAGGVVPAGLAEQGQYRSKILLNPGGAIDKGAELSIEQLEQQIDSIEQPYAKSSAGRHLARHYVEQGDYDKAIAYYRDALAAQGLSDIANREMLRELAQVYLLKEDYAAAAQTLERALQIDLLPEVTDYLLLAQAHYRMGKYVAVVATLDRIQDTGLSLDTVQMRQALALYYRAGAYAQCERLLRRLLELEPDDPQHWHLLASVYLQQDKKRQALDQLALAREKSVPFTEPDILLLVDLHGANDNPYGAAEILADALAQQQVKASGANYRKLFEFWLQAREKDKAGKALHKAAQLSGDTELYLYLARLQMEQRAWQPMYQTMLAACARQLPDRYVGRANLLLGISQLKLGDEQAARRSFINATLIGGANIQAGQWLQFMEAEPATEDEVRRIVGICYGAQDKRMQAASSSPGGAAAREITSEAASPEAIRIKTVPPLRFYYAEYDLTPQQLAEKMQSLAVRMNVSLVKSGGSADGPLHIIALGEAVTEGEVPALQLALPARGSARAGGKYRIRRSDAFKCAYLEYEGEGAGLVSAWTRFAGALQAAGHELTGERRLVIPAGANAGGTLKTELQVGIN